MVRVDGFVKPAHEMKAYGYVDEKQQHQMAGPSSSTAPVPGQEVVMTVEGAEDEGAPLISMAECRICQEEDSLANLEAPCACSGSLKVYFPNLGWHELLGLKSFAFLHDFLFLLLICLSCFTNSSKLLSVFKFVYEVKSC